ncbi:MAG: dinitrogenase iron-molybdenum cofactor biosynthesis protein [candidate division Zixibacteria bacterium]|nr:dinitrogenase iron-molybdenum cofactor biosynthesis protein [candidate division Zixibacteria bacterium]
MLMRFYRHIYQVNSMARGSVCLEGKGAGAGIAEQIINEGEKFMLVAITAKTSDADSEVEPRFGRAPYFHVVDTETGNLEIIENTQNMNAVQGAGIQSADKIASKKVDALLTGHCGPKAFQVLKTAGINIVVGVRGEVKDVVEKFKNDEYKYADSHDVEAHW